jgi:hypothetical protein
MIQSFSQQLRLMGNETDEAGSGTKGDDSRVVKPGTEFQVREHKWPKAWNTLRAE